MNTEEFGRRILLAMGCSAEETEQRLGRVMAALRFSVPAEPQPSDILPDYNTYVAALKVYKEALETGDNAL